MDDLGNGALSTTIGPYRLLQKIGAGGMAEVYLGLAFGASGFEKRVAIKVLRPELRDNARLLKLLIEEARLCARLQHRNLVQVGVGRHQGIEDQLAGGPALPGAGHGRGLPGPGVAHLAQHGEHQGIVGRPLAGVAQHGPQGPRHQHAAALPQRRDQHRCSHRPVLG